ncbi:MAG: serine/threonine protein kinase [Spirirestis rafaelensis WJT71-NPBG6]|jgi:serine/threonine-protein kinase|nr:serine/threonine protein kinase [Spirirestis rafaelensis WJT71-NPBG6]
MQVYCSKQHANNQSNRFCIHCGEPLPLATGKVVENRYHILRQLGQGGFGRTYLALDKNQSNENCVLKEFAPQVEAQQDLLKAKELFEREASVLKKLQHPQIPRFHASLQAKLGNKDFFFLVQDYVEGDNYYELLEQRQTFSEDEVIKLLQQILPVLSYIHSLDVVHRDISPDNLILRSSDNLPVLIDFGGVKQLPASKGFWFTQLGGNRTLLGKKGYAPEEQLRQGKAFPSSDLYSLAVTALVLLTGKEPQHLYDSYQGVWRWGQEIKVSSQLEAVLKRMLAYKPSDRYQTANEVIKDLNFSIAVKAANPHITKLKTMIAAPGRQRAGAVVSSLHKRSQLVAGALPLPVWLRPFAVSLVGTTAVVLTFAGTWAVVNAVGSAVSSISVSVPSISLPKLPGGSNPGSKPTNDKQISQIVNRREELEIPQGFFTRTVDNLFYTEKPELQGRTLTSNPEDNALRKEWYGVADNLLDKLEQAKLSTSSRRKLGNYGSQDYEAWRRKAQAGQLGDYTISQLNRDTNQKFDRLFPGQRRGKLNQKTLGQIWYAIAADQVNKRQQ